jgi:hypothetical protein
MRKLVVEQRNSGEIHFGHGVSIPDSESVTPYHKLWQNAPFRSPESSDYRELQPAGREEI